MRMSFMWSFSVFPGDSNTNGVDAGGATVTTSSRRPWCSLAYWELRQRSGPLYAVRTPSVHVFESLPQGDGMCLAQIQQPSCDSDAILRVRDKIGAGLTLSQGQQAVWLYNRSDYPLFVKPERKLGTRDVMGLMRDHYEGTDYDMTRGVDAGPYATPNR